MNKTKQTEQKEIGRIKLSEYPGSGCFPGREWEAGFEDIC